MTTTLLLRLISNWTSFGTIQGVIVSITKILDRDWFSARNHVGVQLQASNLNFL